MAVQPHMTEGRTRGARVPGLDGLRFWCALWVVFGHLGFLPLVDGADTTHLAGRISRLIYNNLTPGPAAVIVFFVISGFCIHFPYRKAETVPLVPFFVRRYLRILIPVVVAIGLSRRIGVELKLFDKSVLWSLVCEEVYYAAYPLLLRLRLRFGWSRLIAVSYGASVLIGLHTMRGGDYPSFGTFGVPMNVALGLPCWLLGCKLAESYEPSDSLSKFGIKWWRAVALISAMLASMARFHSPITYPLTLNVFAFYAYFWLREEIRNSRGLQPGFFARAGAFSYSIYLIHPLAPAGLDALALPSLGKGVDWIVLISFILAASFAFYLAVERPSHLFARRAYVWLRSRSTDRADVYERPSLS